MDDKENNVNYNNRKAVYVGSSRKNNETCNAYVFEKKSKEKEVEGNETSEQDVEKIVVSTGSVFLFQLFVFFIFFLVLLIGSFNFSFKLFQVREKHLHEFLDNIKDVSTCTYITHYREDLDEKKKVHYEDDTKRNHNDTLLPHINFKYYFTRGKHYKKIETKRGKNSKDIKIFICINKKKKFFENNKIFDIFLRGKRCIIKIITFVCNEISNAFFSKGEYNDGTFSHGEGFRENYLKHHSEEVAKYVYYNFLLSKNNTYKNYYLNVESLFYMYLYDICYYHDGSGTNDTLGEYTNWEEDNSTGNRGKKDITLLIRHIDKYLNDDILLNVLQKLYIGVCMEERILKFLSKREKMEKMKKKKGEFFLNENINQEEYYNLYHKIEGRKNINKYIIFMNKLKKKIRTIQVLKGLNICEKNYIRNLDKVPFYFFMDDFYFSFYSIGITSYVHKSVSSMPNAFPSSPYLYSAYSSLREKFAFE
ncbi:conserved Plasmodium protein, unknown function [Plasmodium ovale curtisi]|uniref:Uncharacterized protein n=1 Tax=Plasmodium ovale curtisi TaxID=864141 RepID=A0A1A8VSK6_PLAOA|nr:conserved Plasmodium protein, unknown function [Plasmodium ovale curtisi]SBS90668.1 conserved Plasmodium protein, unknown function [Plasmodium ovale curtisi]